MFSPGGILNAGITTVWKNSAFVKKVHKMSSDQVSLWKRRVLWEGICRAQFTVSLIPTAVEEPKATVKYAEVVEGETPHLKH